MYSVDQNKLQQKSYVNIQNLESKRVLLRSCLNVTTDKEGNMLDATRYEESFPAIQYFATNAKALVITAHLGRPKNKEPEYSFRKIAQRLEHDLGQKVTFIENLEDLKTVSTGVYMLENVRFFPSEDAKEEADKAPLLAALAECADVFVNDAFADYRKSVSTYDIAKRLPSYVGPVFMKEILALAKLTNPARPFVAVLGGAKLSEKLDAMLSMAEFADKVLVGGAMAYTLLKAQNIPVGNSLVEDDKLSVAKEILEKYGNKIILPRDHGIVSSFADPGKDIVYTADVSIPEGKIAVDIGPKTIEVYGEKLAEAKTIVWNGPMGVFEWEATAVGTREIGRAIGANAQAYKVAGGGDSIAAINTLGIRGIDHVSTGGGAMLAVLGSDAFPTLDVILTK